jgi:hypothetical protein
MSISVDGVPRYRFAVSTGRAGYGTPSGTYHPQRLAAVWHGQKLVVHTRRDGSMTVAALRAFDSGWGWETDRYVEAHWDEYVDAARAGTARAASVTSQAICLWMSQGWLRMSPGVRLQGGAGRANKDSSVASLSRLRPRAAVWLTWLLAQAPLQGHTLGSSSAPAGAAARHLGFTTPPRYSASEYRTVQHPRRSAGAHGRCSLDQLRCLVPSPDGWRR